MGDAWSAGLGHGHHGNSHGVLCQFTTGPETEVSPAVVHPQLRPYVNCSALKRGR